MYCCYILDLVYSHFLILVSTQLKYCSAAQLHSCTAAQPASGGVYILLRAFLCVTTYNSGNVTYQERNRAATLTLVAPLHVVLQLAELLL